MTETYKVLAQSCNNDTTLDSIYTVGALTSAVISSIVITNTTAAAATCRLKVAVANAADTLKQYLLYDYTVDPNSVITLPLGMTLATTDQVYFKQGTAQALAVTLFGLEIT